MDLDTRRAFSGHLRVDESEIRMIVGRRNGRQPNERMQEVLKKTIEDARAMTSKVNAIFSFPQLLNSMIPSDHPSETGAARETGHAKDGPRSFGLVTGRRDDRVSHGATAARRDTQGV